MESAIEANAARFGMPVRWIESVVKLESGGRACRAGRGVRSRAGAAGVMQLMGPTWTEMRAMFDIGSSVDDPAANIAAGTAYLRLMYDRFGYPGAFAAYNAGPGRYRQSLSGRPLPEETRHYLQAIQAQIAGLPTVSSAASLLDRPKVFIVPPEAQGGMGLTPSGDLLFVLKR